MNVANVRIVWLRNNWKEEEKSMRENILNLSIIFIVLFGR